MTMMTTKSSQGGRRLLPTTITCSYCAVLLAGHSVGAAATAASSSKSASARSLSENKAYLGQYKFDTKSGFGMPADADIDQDMELIVSNLEKNDDAGFAKAHEVYMNGRNFDGDYFLELDISDLSENADVDLKDSSTFKTYTEYYGVSNYADVWAQASFEGKLASELENGKFDFTKLDRDGRAAAIRLGLPLLHVWMYVLGSVEGAAASCLESGDNSARAMAWDDAVALYAGSGALESGKGGYFVYTLVQDMCHAFGTCAVGDRAPLNAKLFEHFRDGRQNLKDGDCSGARAHAGHIKGLMTVPLVQGVIRAAYALDVQDDKKAAAHGIGAAFSAAILPLLHACNDGNADVVYNDLKPGNTGGSYEVVKSALERSYECLNVDCEDVGGLVDLLGDGYLAGAEACNGLRPVAGGSVAENDGGAVDAPSSASSAQTSSSNDVPLIALVGGLFGALCFLFGFAIAFVHLKKKRADSSGVDRVFVKKIVLDSSPTSSTDSDEPKGIDKEIV